MTMATISALRDFCEGNPPVSGVFLSQRPSNAELWYAVSLEELFNKQSSCRWFEMRCRPAVCWGAHQRKHINWALLSSVRENHRWSVDSLHKGPVIQMIFPFYDVIMTHSNNALVSFNTSATGISYYMYDIIYSNLCASNCRFANHSGTGSKSHMPWPARSILYRHTL